MFKNSWVSDYWKCRIKFESINCIRNCKSQVNKTCESYEGNLTGCYISRSTRIIWFFSLIINSFVFFVFSFVWKKLQKNFFYKEKKKNTYKHVSTVNNTQKITCIAVLITIYTGLDSRIATDFFSVVVKW